jgi:hypothetical protein
MYAHHVTFRLISIVVAAIGFASFDALAADSAFPSAPGPSKSEPILAIPGQSAAPSANNEAFKTARTKCEVDVPANKANSDVCVEAAALLLGADLPDAYREMSEELRIKFALRLLERVVDRNNVARGRAYDMYSKIGFLGVNSYTDAYRASELMDMMIKSNYAGGILRKARGTTSILSFTSNEAEKREGCNTAKKFLSEGKLDADSLAMATEIAGSGVCKGYDQPPAK